ncbi:hypothetical protein EROM_090350 [Encephalitozoon romaleae SJ-2008]|uniref:Uncharacterized protein n=1 Tax=Encephalitozoon romaleae (strain SJ-2008) TaxID=1178016 RepID=I7ATA6_ENCRO|nr:hypothetical protein EROM_090350 [Encephalitozoon romaleae SJ-2008]AFN83652.1 hypothetical protein EROM_090350 [Encephalitozoon romaleae SJ-2008]
MEENITESGIPSTGFGGQEILIGEVPNEDAFVICPSQGNIDKKAVHSKDSSAIDDISKCKKHRVDNCICLSKIHYEVDGDILCAREMKPFFYINKVSILRLRRASCTKANTERQKDT